MKRIRALPDPTRDFSRRRQFQRQQRGAIMLLLTVVILGLIGMMALSIDLGFLFSRSALLQNGINAAALAAGAGLRVTVEADPGAPEQKNIALAFARRYAGENQSDIDIEPEDVIIDVVNDLPTVQVKTSTPAPMFFAGLFGFDSIDMNATATASLLPVDGGTGTIGTTGVRHGGCWRPLFLPDTFYDSSNRAQIVGDNTFGTTRLPNQPGDYYHSRFAAGARNTFPFVDPVAGAPSLVTGLRDTQLSAEATQGQTIMGYGAGSGEDPITFRRDFYFIANFSGLPSVKVNDRTVRDQASFGYCGKIRVGDEIPVYPINNPVRRDEARLGLLDLQANTINGDRIEVVEESMFRYVKSASYPVPNTHGAIIPVLFYDPMLANNVNGITTLRVTNIGLFFLKEITVDSDLKGYFVREIIAGGTPIDPINLDNRNDDSFRRRWLPMSVQLLR